MPHSGGGGSHSGGGHSGGGHSGGSHSSGSGGGGRSVRVSSTPFSGCHTYAVYDKQGNSKIVYSDSSNYHVEKTKKDLISGTIFGSVFMIPGIVELIVIIVLFISCFHLGVRKTNVPKSVDNTVYIYDYMDMISDEEEVTLQETLEEFRDKTGIIPAVEFTVDELWNYDYEDMEAFAYNEYVTTFDDEYHLLIVYSYGAVNDATNFNEFHWESMWGDNLSKTASSKDEKYLAKKIQANLTKANGSEVANAIGISFDKFYGRLNEKGFRFDSGKLIISLFLLVHGGIFFAAGLLIVVSTRSDYKMSKESGEATYKIKGVPEVMQCSYCGTSYYKGTIGSCRNCGASIGDETQTSYNL